MMYLVPVGRVFFSFIFIMTILSHFSQGAAGYAASQGVPLASIAAPLSGLLAFLGGG
jgi:putative oxidoreductase